MSRSFNLPAFEGNFSFKATPCPAIFIEVARQVIGHWEMD